MKEYLVRWEIQITAESPIEAAKEALKYQRDNSSEANTFEVGEDANCLKSIDLDEEDSNSKILKELIAEFPDCWFKPGHEFDNGKAAVWSGEGSSIGDEQAFDPNAWEWDIEENHFTMMVNNKLHNYVKERGYYWECYDPGTFFLYEI